MIGGSLAKGILARVDPSVRLAHLAVGTYVVAESDGLHFLGMVSDIGLDAMAPAAAKNPPERDDPFQMSVLAGTTTFGILQLSLLLVFDETTQEVRPVKTVPSHFARLVPASQEEIDRVFGPEGRYVLGHRQAFGFHIGSPLEMADVKITVDLARLVERSAGVFGKTGSGKSFLTRLLLTGIIKSGIAVTLTFDMHNEYGDRAAAETPTGNI